MEENRGMPLLIDNASFNEKLNISKKNHEHTKKFLEEGTEPFKLHNFVVPHGYKLLKSRGTDHYRLVTDQDIPETVYAVKLKFMSNIVPSKRTCTQIMVWKTVQPQFTEVVDGFPQRFFEYFLDTYSIVVSDDQHTQDGKRFWERRIAWALQNDDYFVYISDGTKEDRPLSLIDNWDQFYSQWNEFCWGNDKDCHIHRLIVISKEQLN